MTLDELRRYITNDTSITPEHREISDNLLKKELKELKKGLNFALKIIKKQKKYDQVWDWMEERKDGEYIKIDELINDILKMLKS